jgi:hypothetical protein
MESSVATTDERTDNGAVEHTPAEHATPQEMFRYSAFVHVGAGAAECEDGENGSCGNPTHFHAWCRLPNQHQHGSIREKAMAAKARKIRQLRDPDTDGYLVLESELDEAAGQPEKLINELVNKDFFRDRIEAMRDLTEQDEQFATIRADQERFAALMDTAEDQRNADEFGELEKHVGEFTRLLEERVAERQGPLRESLASKTPDELRNLVRADRVNREASMEFQRVYSLWEQFVCTLRPAESGTPSARVFNEVTDLQAAAPEVIDALDDIFTELESSLAGGSAEGN